MQVIALARSEMQRSRTSITFSTLVKLIHFYECFVFALIFLFKFGRLRFGHFSHIGFVQLSLFKKCKTASLAFFGGFHTWQAHTCWGCRGSKGVILLRRLNQRKQKRILDVSSYTKRHYLSESVNEKCPSPDFIQRLFNHSTFSTFRGNEDQVDKTKCDGGREEEKLGQQISDVQQ